MLYSSTPKTMTPNSTEIWLKNYFKSSKSSKKKKKKTMRDNNPSHPIKVIKTTASKQMPLPQMRPTMRISNNKPKAPIQRKQIKADPREN